ncbi:hypothetical protein Q428_06330 [Fervidicella metallireducens AeB]|uniref:ACT domain-containing protein n=1 Tax=Fervidicella metallireducens AeB TaxID=1403537 RepID=A0A017RWI2_9CLOT|nr:hypothetical protein [Fervidicella metallireducens]EYE88764.1 hypothetical protein Q428_06330 [Fervidicella metallireducens AeB]
MNGRILAKLNHGAEEITRITDVLSFGEYNITGLELKVEENASVSLDIRLEQCESKLYEFIDYISELLDVREIVVL